MVLLSYDNLEWAIPVIIIALLVGCVMGALLSWKQFEKRIKDKPLVSKHQIKQLFSQTGHKLSEKRLHQITKEFNQGI